jgi:hypothetical protein
MTRQLPAIRGALGIADVVFRKHAAYWLSPASDLVKGIVDNRMPPGDRSQPAQKTDQR